MIKHYSQTLLRKLTNNAHNLEGFLDIYLFRFFGDPLAIVFQRLGTSPNSVTIMGMCFGITAGHLFYYNNLLINLIGILLWIISQILDGTDGQLARLTNQSSRYGRILDGMADNLKFVSIYSHICIRIILAANWWWIILIAVLAGVSHSIQSLVADCYRNVYLHFIGGSSNNSDSDQSYERKSSELDNSYDLFASYQKLKWRKDFIKKFLMRFYVNYTRQQELVSTNIKQLLLLSKETFGDEIPQWFIDKYKELNQPMLKYYKILVTNPRITFLFIVLILDKLYLYFFFELTVLNAILIFVIIRQNKIIRALVSSIETPPLPYRVKKEPGKNHAQQKKY